MQVNERRLDRCEQSVRSKLARKRGSRKRRIAHYAWTGYQISIEA
jgi:hypothetical protein